MHPLMEILAEKDLHLILASGSPRRKEILSKLTDQFTVQISDFPEDLDKTRFDSKRPEEYAVATALAKGENVATTVKTKRALILSADTIVVGSKGILEKPKNRDHAKKMLESLSEGWSEVITGVALVEVSSSSSLRTHTFYERTRVHFGEITPATMSFYLDNEIYLDKAGAYGYQGLASLFISKIEGCYYNVVGLPLHRIVQEVSSFLE